MGAAPARAFSAARRVCYRLRRRAANDACPFRPLRFDERAGTHPLQAIDHNAVARVQARRNDAKPFNVAAEGNRAIERAIVGAHDQDEFLVLIGANRPFVDQHDRLLLRLAHPQPCKLTRDQPAVLIVERGANADGAALALTWLSISWMRPLTVTPEDRRHLHRDLIEFAALAAGIGDRTDCAQHDVFVSIETAVDRIDRNQRGQHRR